MEVMHPVFAFIHAHPVEVLAVFALIGGTAFGWFLRAWTGKR